MTPDIVPHIGTLKLLCLLKETNDIDDSLNNESRCDKVGETMNDIGARFSE